MVHGHFAVGDDYTLVACQTFQLANVIKAFNFFVDSTNGLHLSALVNGPRYGQSLTDRIAGEAGQKSI